MRSGARAPLFLAVLAMVTLCNGLALAVADEPMETVSLAEACHRLGMHVVTGRRLIREGKFPVPVIKLTRQYRVPVAPLEARLRDLGK